MGGVEDRLFNTDAPAAVLRVRWRGLAAQGLCAAAVLAAVLLVGPRMLVSWPLLALAGWWWYRAGRLRVVRRATRARGVACEHCLYDLRGAGEGGWCPECGRSFYASELPERWARAAGCDLWEVQWPEHSPRFRRRVWVREAGEDEG